MVLFSQQPVFLFQHHNTLFKLGYLLHQHRQKLLDARRGVLPILAADLFKNLCERLPPMLISLAGMVMQLAKFLPP